MNYKDDDIIKKSAEMDIPTMEHLAHLAGICLFKLNLDTKEIALNLNTTRIAGYNIEDLPTTGETKESMIHVEDLELVNTSIASIISGENDYYHIQYRMHRCDSSVVWIEEIGVISNYDESGKPTHISSLALDLSRLKDTENKARMIEVELKRVAEGLYDHTTLLEENRLLRAATAASSIIVGGFYQDYELLLQQSLQMLGESLQADFTGIWRNRVKNDKVNCFLRSYWTKAAHLVGVNRSAQLFSYDDFLPNWQELFTEQKDYAVIENNQLSPEFIKASDMAKIGNTMILPLYLHGEFWGIIGFSRPENMPFKAYEATAIKVGAMIIAASVSRNETLGKINVDREKAMASTLAKSEFLSRMSHEMRTPLNAIIGMTNIAIKESNPQKILEYIKKIESSSHLMLNVINDVLDISKIEAGKLVVIKEEFDFHKMIEHACSIVKVKMDEKNQHFAVNFDEAITHLIISDEHRLAQVVVNLLNNAMKFTPEGGEISLTVCQKRINNKHVKIKVEVKDNGIGISPMHTAKLFSAFEQADGSITRKYGGSGLGLTICKKILHVLDGDIWVKSKLGQGSCFFFEIETEIGDPVKKYEDSIHDKLFELEEKAFNWSNYTILVADDVEINREIVEIMLEKTKIKIVGVENGQEAVDEFIKSPNTYDLILMDMQMPVMDGLTATDIIRKSNIPHGAKIPIIAMTANAFKEDIDICLSIGMNEHISKPFSPSVFFNTLANYLN